MRTRFGFASTAILGALLCFSSASAHERLLPPCLVSLSQVTEGIEHCMRAALWPKGPEEGPPVMSPESAALLCQRAWTPEAARALPACVRALMFERSGLGSRRADLDAEAAAFACQYATHQPAAELIEGCMRRMMYDRDGLGYQRTELTAQAAAYACREIVAMPMPFLYRPQCRAPSPQEALRLIDDCVSRLMFQREGLGERRRVITGNAAVLACQGALRAAP